MMTEPGMAGDLREFATGRRAEIADIEHRCSLTLYVGWNVV
jgi:hypothetical protein